MRLKDKEGGDSHYLCVSWWREEDGIRQILQAKSLFATEKAIRLKDKGRGREPLSLC
jgi:hypothetical protein